MQFPAPAPTGTQVSDAAVVSRLAVSGLFAADATESSIRAAALAALAAGGGTVYIPAGVIPITSPLPVGSGLHYVGVASSGVNYTVISNAGTILVGDGTFNCFEWNPNDSASLPVSSTAMFAGSPVGFGLRRLKMRNFKYGVKFGAFQSVGIQALVLDDLSTERCLEWGLWTENCQGMKVGSHTGFSNRRGQHFHCSSMGSIWYFGNDVLGNINLAAEAPGGAWTTTELANMRGYVQAARGAGSILNDVVVQRLQHNGFAMSTVTQAASLVFSSSNPTRIAISGNIDRYQVDNALQFGSSGSGFFAQRPYLIVTKTDTGGGAGWVEVAEKKGGTPIAATDAATSTTITIKGAALLEVGGIGDAASVGGTAPIVLNTRMLKTDLENGGSVSVLLQNLQQSDLHFGLVGGASGTVSVAAIGISANNTLYSPALLQNVYFYGQFSFVGVRPLSFLTGAPTGTYSFRGMVVDTVSNNRMRLHLGGTNPNGQGDLTAYGSALMPNLPVATSVQEVAAGPSLDGYKAVVVFNGASAQNFTLPAPSSANVGTDWAFANETAFDIKLFATGFLINGVTVSTGYLVYAHSEVEGRIISNGGSFGWSLSGGAVAP